MLTPSPDITDVDMSEVERTEPGVDVEAKFVLIELASTRAERYALCRQTLGNPSPAVVLKQKAGWRSLESWERKRAIESGLS